MSVDGRLQHVERFDSPKQANQRRRELRARYAGHERVVVSNVTVERETTDFQGMHPESALLFAEAAGVNKDAAVQALYREATSQRSALRRLFPPRPRLHHL